MKLKNLFSVLFISISLLFTINVKAQNDLKQALSTIKEKIVEVPVDKIVFRESLEILNDDKGKLNYISVEVDDKGKTKKESYEFYISDIDKNTIIRKTEGKKMLVSLSINNKQKFIKYFKEDKLESYVSDFEILVSNADAAQELMDLFKKAIPLVKTNENQWATNTEALNWLKSNIGEVNLKNGINNQTFTFGERKDYLVSLAVKKTDLKGVTTEEKYDFNILDINKNQIQLKISGDQLTVHLETKGNDKFIKCFKNNVQQSYDNEVNIYTGDIDQARNIISAFTLAINKSKAKMPEFGNVQQAIDFIKSNTGDVTIDDKTTKQSIDLTSGQGTKAKYSMIESDSKGKTTESINEFYLADLEINAINFKVSGKKITLLGNIKNKSKFIKYTKEGVIQNYQNDLEIITSDIETTREVIEAYKYAIKASEMAPVSFGSVAEAIGFLASNIKGEAVNTDQYKLSFEGQTAEPYQCKFTKSKTDEKGKTVEQVYEFYPYMLETNTTKVESSGKYLVANMKIKDKKSFVKVYKDGEQQSYDNEVELLAFDAKQAKDIAEALKYIATNGKPKDKDFSNKQVAVQFAIDNIGNLKGEGKEVKQKLEILNNEPCKLNLTINTIDDKGKTIEEIYEFSLADMNKLMVDYKISGKNVIVVLVCKNKQKLIKAYKNGQQQSYTADIEIIDDDVETAKNIADALKNAIIACEQ